MPLTFHAQVPVVVSTPVLSRVTRTFQNAPFRVAF